MKAPAALGIAALMLLIGLVGGRLTAPRTTADDDATRARAGRDGDDTGRSGSELRSPSFRAAADAPAEDGVRVEAEPDADEPDESGALFSPALLEHARGGLQDGWSSVRRDEPGEAVISEGMGMFQEATLAMPPGIGAKLARRKTSAEQAAEDARTGGAFAVLDRLMDGEPGPLPEVVEPKATFDNFFQTAGTGPTRDAVSVLGEREAPEDGTTLTFPAGVFAVGDFGRMWGDDYPADLTLRGAGRDATMLVLESDWSAYGRVRNLTIEGLTIHANNNYLFDVRKPSMSITIRRCRLTGWTTGAGSSCLFGTEGLVLRVEDTEITGAYCRIPASGQMFDVRHAGLLARFENCTIEAMRPFASFRSGGTVAFVGCRIRNAVGRSTEIPGGVSLPGTEVDWFQGEDESALARDLDELFPDWESRMER